MYIIYSIEKNDKAHDHPTCTSFDWLLCLKIFNTTTNADTTNISRGLLKLSGRISNPFEGANLAKKISGPPKAKMSVWDSKLAAVEMIEVASTTVLVYDGVHCGDVGSRGAYL